MPGLAELRFGRSVPIYLSVPVLQGAAAAQIGVARTGSSWSGDLNLFHARSGGTFKCVRVCGVDVNEPGNSIRVRRRDRAHFCAGDGMADEHRPRQFQGVDDREYIVAKTIEWVIRNRETRCTESAPCDAVDVVIGRELRRKVVEHMRRVPAAGQQDDRLSRAAPIEYFEPHALFNSDEPHGVW